MLKRDTRFDVKKNVPLDPEQEVSTSDLYNEFERLTNRFVILLRIDRRNA